MKLLVFILFQTEEKVRDIQEKLELAEQNLNQSLRKAEALPKIEEELAVRMAALNEVQYRQKVWTHQVVAKPRFSRLPRTRFGRQITARFSGNASVDRKPRPNRRNY